VALPDTSAPCAATDKDELGIDFPRVKSDRYSSSATVFEWLVASAVWLSLPPFRLKPMTWHTTSTRCGRRWYSWINGRRAVEDRYTAAVEFALGGSKPVQRHRV